MLVRAMEGFIARLGCSAYGISLSGPVCVSRSSPPTVSEKRVLVDTDSEFTNELVLVEPPGWGGLLHDGTVQLVPGQSSAH